MITTETVNELAAQQENLYLVNSLIDCTDKDMEVIVSSCIDGIAHSIIPPKEILLPFLDECKACVMTILDGLNQKAKAELSDVD